MGNLACTSKYNRIYDNNDCGASENKTNHHNTTNSDTNRYRTHSDRELHPSTYLDEEDTNLTTTSSKYSAEAKQKWAGFDANFLLHPQHFLSATNSNADNESHYTMNRYLTTSPVTISPAPIISSSAVNELQLIDARHISFEYSIGVGRFGKIFRALWTDTNTKLQKPVTVEWFKQNDVDHEIFEDFLKEISVATQLSPHQNVLQIYGFCISPYALVTEYINGGSVENCVSCKHQTSMRCKITMADVVEMLIDAAEGISQLHTVNMIHGEIAARNLLIENDNMTEKEVIISNWSRLYNVPNDISHLLVNFIPKRRVVVCDFGHSPITQNQYDGNITNSHVGPLKWMSPESIKQQIYNSKTDVYSFGILMWEVLCGMAPYPNTKVLSLAIEVISKQTRPFILDWFPRALAILMQRCWQEIPEFRPTFQDIKNELKLFKQELIDTNKTDDGLPNISPFSLPQTKEKVRSLNDLVNNYLNPSVHRWDAFIQPKLIKLIQEYNHSHTS